MVLDSIRTQLKFTVGNFSAPIQSGVWTTLISPVLYAPVTGTADFNRTGNNIFATSFTINV